MRLTNHVTENSCFSDIKPHLIKESCSVILFNGIRLLKSPLNDNCFYPQDRLNGLFKLCEGIKPPNATIHLIRCDTLANYIPKNIIRSVNIRSCNFKAGDIVIMSSDSSYQDCDRACVAARHIGIKVILIDPEYSLLRWVNYIVE